MARHPHTALTGCSDAQGLLPASDHASDDILRRQPEHRIGRVTRGRPDIEPTSPTFDFNSRTRRPVLANPGPLRGRPDRWLFTELSGEAFPRPTPRVVLVRLMPIHLPDDALAATARMGATDPILQLHAPICDPSPVPPTLQVRISLPKGLLHGKCEVCHRLRRRTGPARKNAVGAAEIAAAESERRVHRWNFFPHRGRSHRDDWREGRAARAVVDRASAGSRRAANDGKLPLLPFNAHLRAVPCRDDPATADASGARTG